MHLAGALAGCVQVAGEVGQAGREVPAVPGFPFVEGSDPLGLLGDLQQRRGDDVSRFVRWPAHVLLTATGSVPDRPS